LNIACGYDSGTDNTTVSINGWTTNSTYYIRIFTPYNTSTECNLSQRHDGKWKSTAYNMYMTLGGRSIEIREDFVRIEGIQFGTNSAYATTEYIFINATGTGDIRISHCIFQGSDGVQDECGINLYDTNNKILIFNNIFYDCAGAVYQNVHDDIDTTYFYNNTLYNINDGLKTVYGTIIAINNLFKDCTQDAVPNVESYEIFGAGTDYNATTNASIGYTVTGGGNIHDKLSQTVTFVNEGSGDFHLAYADTSARASGTNLSADGNLAVVDDVDLIPRPTTYDIGADQFDILKPRNRIENY
jgi:hypothetical protein